MAYLRHFLNVLKFPKQKFDIKANDINLITPFLSRLDEKDLSR
nr:hypothetical protein [Campylobacter hyointestinalis]